MSTSTSVGVKSEIEHVLNAAWALTGDLVTLKQPTVAAAVVAFILKVVPVDVPSTVLLSVVAAVGFGSGVIRKVVGQVKEDVETV